MKVLLLGKGGQLGQALAPRLRSLGELVAAGRAEADLADPDALRACVDAATPDAIVNAAAYTAVDRAESEPELAMQVNGEAPGVLAEAAKARGALLVHYSTDYVFNGTKPAPYVESDPPCPLNAYGRSKLAGEQAIQAVGCRHLIFRTSWVYSATGRNFLLTILKLAREREELRIVDDQIGAPTTADMLAEATVRVLGMPDPIRGDGLFHLTASGETSWHGFASAIVAAAGLPARVMPIKTKDYPSPAARPANSRLDNSKFRLVFGFRPANWEAGMAATMMALAASTQPR